MVDNLFDIYPFFVQVNDVLLNVKSELKLASGLFYSKKGYVLFFLMVQLQQESRPIIKVNF